MAKRKPQRKRPPVRPAPTRPTGHDGEKVMIGFPHGGPGSFQPEWVKSLVFMLVHDANTKQRVVNGGAYLQYGTTNIPLGRNKIVETFLNLPGIDWLLFLDNDHSFDPDLLERMIESAHEADTKILGALVFSVQKGDAQEIKPTIWHIDEEGRLGRVVRVPPDRHWMCPATGTGCVLIHREVFEAVRDFVPPHSDVPYGKTSWPWFRYTDWESEAGPDILGEDITFFLRAAAAGYPTVVDTTIDIGHVKRGNVGLNEYRMQTVQEPAPKHVVIPVKGKRELTDALIGQMLEQGEAAHIWIMDNGGDYSHDDDRVTVTPSVGQNIHEMWNRGIRFACEHSGPRTDVAILNNDLRIGPEFLSRLSEALRHHPRVLAVSPNYDGRPAGDGFQQVHGICANRYDGTGGLAGFAFMVRGEAFAAEALKFDEDLQWWFGDNDLCLQMEKMEGVYGIATTAMVEHLDGGSQTAKDEDLEARVAADRAHFEKKWDVRTVPA